MKRVAFAVPGDLSTPTGGYVYDRRIIAELPALGWTVDALDIGDGFPHPAQRTRAEARQRLAARPRGQLIVIDGLAFGVLAEARALRSPPLVALVHHPLALETGLRARPTRCTSANARRSPARIGSSRPARDRTAAAPTTMSLRIGYRGAARHRPGGAARPRRAGGTVALLAVGRWSRARVTTFCWPRWKT